MNNNEKETLQKTFKLNLCIFNQEWIKKLTIYILNYLINYIPELNQIIELNLQIKIFDEMMNNITNWKKYNVSQYEILFWRKELTIIS